MLTPKDIPFLCDINSADALDENFDSSLEEAFSHFEDFFQNNPTSTPLGAETETPKPKSDLIGEAALPHKRSILCWPHDLKTGEKLPWGTPLEKGKVVTYSTLKNRWPHDAKTGKKFPWGTPLEKGKIVSYTWLQNHWPHNAKNGKKVSLGIGIDGKNIVTYSKLLEIRPINKLTGALLPYGTSLDNDIIKYYEFKMDYTFIGSDGKTYKGLNAKEKARREIPFLTFKTNRTFKREQKQLRMKKKPSVDASTTKESSNPRKRSKQFLVVPKGSSSCINIPAHQQGVRSTLQSLPLMPEGCNANHRSGQRIEFEPLSRMFLPGLAQQTTLNAHTSSNADIEECGLSPSVFFSGPGG